MAQTYEPIATTTIVGNSTNTITFGSGGAIPQTYTDLIIVFSGSGSNNSQIYLTFNGSSTNYCDAMIYGNSSTAGSQRRTNNSRIQDIAIWTIETSAIIHIMNYTNTTTYKTVLARSNVPFYEVDATVGVWQSTNAINQIDLVSGTVNYTAGSTMTLYGIKAA